jgi:dolichol-phosphate mannosyltransferase
LFVDDASIDRTPHMLHEMAAADQRIKVLRFSRNFGHQSAVTAGIDYAQGDAVVLLDGDLQDPPELITAFVQKWREGYDVIYGIRKKRKEWWGKRLAYYLFYRLLRASAEGVEMPVDAGDFSLISRRALDVVKSLPERNRFVRGLRTWVGFRQMGIPYERHERYAGKPKYTFLRLLRLAYDGLFSFSSVPLHLITLLGVIVSVASFLAILVVLYFRLFTNLSIPGFASLATITLFLGGIQLLSLGVIGEYIGRIYEETKHRPDYVIEERVGF